MLKYILAAALVISPAAAASPADQTCILKVAETLPKIAGMQIGKSRTTPQPAPPGWQGDGPPLRVEIEWSAAGQASKWAYLCAVMPSGAAVVQRLKD